MTAKADYAVRAVVELAGSSQSEPRKVDDIAKAQSIPVSFLENILTQLRSSGVVRSQRGPEGGYWLARPAEELDLAHVIRAVEGPLVGVRGQRPEEIEYAGSAESPRRSGSPYGRTCAKCSRRRRHASRKALTAVEAAEADAPRH